MAVFILVIGFLIFAVGVGGQLVIGGHFTNKAHPGDRKAARMLLTLAAIIIGAWMFIASAAALLHGHSRSHQQTTGHSV